MQLTGEQRIPQSPADVWTSLNDPTILQACIPGCESLESTGDNEYAVVMQAAIGPFKARFKGKLSLLDIQAPNSYTLRFEGTGGVVGFGKGTAQVALEPHDEGTLLRYESAVQLGGKLAQIGSRLVVGAAKKTADDFFEKFRIELEARPGDEAIP
jgi:carbon monoxide dehydrogenase subunit G